MIILSTGQKIKKLRKEMGLTQDKLTNEKVTRSLISMIENDRRKLSWNTAGIIAKALNQYYKVIGVKITPEYLLESEEEQVRRNMREEIDQLQITLKLGNGNEGLMEESFDKLIKIAKEWRIKNELIEIHHLRANYFVTSHRYNHGLKDYFHILEHHIESKDYQRLAEVYNFIGKCYYNQGMMEQGLIYYQKAYETLEEFTPTLIDIKLETVFYIINCYYTSIKYDLALNYIGLFKELALQTEEVSTVDSEFNPQIILMEANIYRNLRKFSKAEEIYRKLLDREAISNVFLLKVYENCAVLYREWGEIQKSFDYINIACKLIEDQEGLQASELLPNILLSQSKCLYKLRKDGEAIKYLKMGLALAKQVHKKETIVDIYFILVQIYISIKDYTSALDSLKEVEGFVLQQGINSKVNDLYSFYAEIYGGLNNRKQSIEYISKIRQDYLAL